MATVNGQNVGDFTNNFASDIGPLLALFGEKMTIQYLSESTSFLDYFIFAMAPIGIITAMVSTIRLCGNASLRAFTGRSQEGEGSIETELCTSISRDVCELFTKGGVQRVLGRPSILELVYIEPDGVLKGVNAQGSQEVGLYLLKTTLKILHLWQVWNGSKLAASPIETTRTRPTEVLHLLQMRTFHSMLEYESSRHGCFG